MPFVLPGGLAEEYTLKRMLGEGAFGAVHKIYSRVKQKNFAVKVIRYGLDSDFSRRKAIEDEVTLLEAYRHSHIVSIEAKLNGNIERQFCIVLEFSPDGDLAGYIERHRAQNMPIPAQKIVSIAAQLCSALHFLHAEVKMDDKVVKVIHRDIKPANLLLFGDIVKLSDLGLTKRLIDTDYANTSCGTMEYLSPELLNRKPYTTASDIWAAGCCIFELASLKIAFDRDTVFDVVNSVTYRPPLVPAHYPPIIQQLVNSLLSVDVKYRPSAERVLSCPELALAARDIGVTIRAQQLEKEIQAQRAGVEEQSRENERTKMLNLAAAQERAAELELKKRLDEARLQEQYEEHVEQMRLRQVAALRTQSLLMEEDSRRRRVQAEATARAMTAEVVRRRNAEARAARVVAELQENLEKQIKDVKEEQEVWKMKKAEQEAKLAKQVQELKEEREEFIRLTQATKTSGRKRLAEEEAQPLEHKKHCSSTSTATENAVEDGSGDREEEVEEDLDVEDDTEDEEEVVVTVAVAVVGVAAHRRVAETNDGVVIFCACLVMTLLAAADYYAV